MTLSKKTLFVAGFAGLLAAGCGGSKAHKSDGAPAPRNPDAQYALDATNFATTEEMKSASWTVIVTVGTTEMARIVGKDYDAMTKAVREIKVKSGDQVTVSVTLKDANGKVLATNVAADAAADAGAKAIWDQQCANKTSNQFSLRDGLNAKFDEKSGLVGINLALCDFVGILVKGSIALEPAQEALMKHEISFECQSEEDGSDRYSGGNYFVMYNLLRTSCKPGYRKGADSPARVLELPADDARASFKANDWWAFNLRLDAHDRPELLSSGMLSDIGALPEYVRNTGVCHTFEFVRHYLPTGAAADQSKETRVVVKLDSTDGEAKWVWDGADKVPFKRNIVDKSGDGQKLTFYVHCTWYSEPNTELGTIPVSN